MVKMVLMLSKVVSRWWYGGMVGGYRVTTMTGLAVAVAVLTAT